MNFTAFSTSISSGIAQDGFDKLHPWESGVRFRKNSVSSPDIIINGLRQDSFNDIIYFRIISRISRSVSILNVDIWKQITLSFKCIQISICNALCSRSTTLLMTGLEYKEITDRLKLAENSVRKYASKIYEKCGVDNKTELGNLFRKKNR